MVEVYQNLFIGTVDEYEKVKDNADFFTVIAAKEPYHRKAVGYSGRSCGKDHPEYLYAERERCLICNLVDVDNPEWISPIIINKAIEDIDKALLKDGVQVLICCNQGKSRSAGIGFMYMKHKGAFGENSDFEIAEKSFRALYPAYEPANGMREYARIHWNEL